MTQAARWSVASVLLGLIALTGCGRQLTQVLLPNSPPELRLERVRLDSPGPDSYAYLARWAANSTGRPISHFVYAIDPVSVDAVDGAWVRTAATQLVLAFPRVEKSSAAYRPHVFTVRAVNDQGVMSAPEWFAVAEDNIPPFVHIIDPYPNRTINPKTTPTVRITWDGFDSDGQFTARPIRYVFRAFGRTNPDFPSIPDFPSFAILYPDSVRALYAPGFPGWTSVGGESTSVELRNLNPGSTYLFAVTGFDEVGDYDPIFSGNKNLLRFDVVFGGSPGPTLTMFNEAFNYTYQSGGWLTDPSRWVPVEVPAGQPVTVNWLATAQEGTNVRCYRWVLDAADLSDETPRMDEHTDWYHWSHRSLNTTSATFSFPGPESHLLYIEAEDNIGRRSLGIVQLLVRSATFEKALLLVDDTRLNPDRRTAAGAYMPPIGPWPTAAELDTFLFARGSVPWKGYPDGTLSVPGIFSGYAFDTIGTRGISADGTIPLSVLGRYQHIVWYTDPTGAGYAGSPQDRSTPITALRLMSKPNGASALTAYVQQGGKVWLCGGGAAYATLIGWNKPGTSPGQYDDLELNPELRPGRMMYDFAHWRAGIQMLAAASARRFDTRVGGFGIGDNRPGRHWPPNPSPPTPSAPPNYSLLPADLQPRSSITDPLPLTEGRYVGEYTAEHIHRPTFIREVYDDGSGLVAEYSTLDTLYLTRGGAAPANSPVMTYYHGREHQPFVFSGFNFWYWRRTQCVELVDWVLQSVWGLQRNATPHKPNGPISARR